MQLPETRQPIWALATAVPATFVLTAMIYFEAEGRSGRLGIADAIMIPIVGSIIISVAALPVIAGLTALALRPWFPNTDAFLWLEDRPVTSLVVSALYTLPAVPALWVAIDSILSATHWFDYIWIPWGVLTTCWLLALRANTLARFH